MKNKKLTWGARDADAFRVATAVAVVAAVGCVDGHSSSSRFVLRPHVT